MTRRADFHDTESLPPGGFFFAPGAIDDEPRSRPLRFKEWQRWLLAYACMALIAVVAGVALGYIDAKGWLL